MNPRNGVLLEGRYVTAEAYAQRVGCSVATVKRWCKAHRVDGNGVVVKFGRQWLVRISEGED